MTDLIIKNARVIDPINGTDGIRDIYIANGKIAASPAPGSAVLDAAGLIAAPGLVDMHTHFRDPGLTHKEDILTGADAAAAGGVTTALCMPNTNPAIDTPETVRYVLEKAAAAKIRVLPYAAVTVGQRGEELTDFRALKNAGAIALSDDGSPVMNAALAREALMLARELDAVIISHCEDDNLAKNYAANEGRVSKLLGITGRPAIAEEIMVARDIMLARDTGARLHIAHVSTKGSVEIIRRAKADGVNVTCETCPQYFILTEDEVLSLGPLARVNPPLRTKEDAAAIIEGLRDGTIDVIATDHAPHSDAEKALPLETAPSGMIGLETMLAASFTALVQTNVLTISQMLAKMTFNPARILGIGAGTFVQEADADITLFDPDEEWTVTRDSFRSRSRNSPFIGKTLRGRVKYTIARGKIVYGST